MAAYFLFYGGKYKKFVDDGRERVPLTQAELDSYFFDPEVPFYTDNSTLNELSLAEFPELCADLEVDDELFIGLAPAPGLYRGLWMGSFDVVAGFTVDADLVKGADVLAAYEAGDATGVAALNPAPLAYDFSDGLGDASCDALIKSKQPWNNGTEYSDFRNNDALVILPFTPALPVTLGDTLYLRITVTALGDLAGNAEACCNKCGDPTCPTFQAGAIYDRVPFDKQRVRKFCNCGTNACADCDAEPCC